MRGYASRRKFQILKTNRILARSHQAINLDKQGRKFSELLEQMSSYFTLDL
jgi:hypothetical protein